MQVDIHQRRRGGLLTNHMTVPDFLDDRAGFHSASLTAFPTSDVVAGAPFGFKSAVTVPASKTLPIAALTAAASAIRPKLYSSIAAALPMAPNGFALFWPAISGADPCTGSYK